MAAKRNIIITTLAVIVPVVIIACVLLITFVVMPNANSGEVIVIRIGSSNITKETEQVRPQNNQLFVVGLVFACGLFVFLLVAIIIAFILAKQARGYVIGSENLESNLVDTTGNEFRQLTDHKFGGKGDQTNVNGTATSDAAKRHSSPVIKSAAPSSSQNLNLAGNLDSNSPHESGCIQKVRPQSYGTLSRTRLMSSVDEDGYYIDKFDYNLGDISPTDENDGNVIDDEVQSILTNLEEDLQGDIEKLQSKTPLKRQLTKQDTFESLPPLKSFDNYLTLVRIDSASNFDSVLEQSGLQEETPEESGNKKEEDLQKE